MDVIDWLLDGDPAIRWQVLRDLTDAPEEQVKAERARVATEGWGARLLALQQSNGQWPVSPPSFSSMKAERWWQSLGPERRGTLFPAWTSTTWSLVLLKIFGLDPDSTRTPASCTSQSMTAKCSRAGGTRSAPCACSAGTSGTSGTSRDRRYCAAGSAGAVRRHPRRDSPGAHRWYPTGNSRMLNRSTTVPHSPRLANSAIVMATAPRTIRYQAL